MIRLLSVRLANDMLLFLVSLCVLCRLFLFQFEGQRSPESCKLFWLNAAHPNINVLKWTSAEDSRLTEFVSRFEGVHWMEIAQGVGVRDFF